MFANRYSPWEHASRARVDIHWHAFCLPPGVDHVYVLTQETLILRPSLPADRLNAAVAIGLAERDLLQRGPQYGMTEPADIAAHRLIPLADLSREMTRCHGGITAVAAALTVPPTLVLRRLNVLTLEEGRGIQQAGYDDPALARAALRAHTVATGHVAADTGVMGRMAG